jgi:hypothetical protein
MKTTAKLFLGQLLVIATLCGQEPIAPLTREHIRQKDAAARARVYQELRPQSLANQDDYIGVLADGVRDPSADVKVAAATKTAYAMLAFQKAKREKQRLPVKVSEFSDLQKALFEALNDPDARVRAPASAALIHSSAPNRAIEQALLQRLAKETNPEIQVNLVKDMSLAGYESPGIESVLLAALEDPDKKTREQAARAIGIVKPKQGLPALAKRLGDTEMMRGFVVSAIAAYGKDAAPYLPELERLLLDKTANGTLPVRIQQAIEAINNPQPQQATPTPSKPQDLGSS